MTHRKKLIEVAMPLEAINREAYREGFIYRGNPSSVHKWWAQRPLAACRAVLFGQLVDDPGSVPEEFPTAAAQIAERERLHRLIERLVPWEASTDERVLNEARREIARSIARWRADRGEAEAVDARMRFEEPSPDEVNRYLAEKAPPVHDPFAGGGSIPLEAQRLGLRAIASDLNPVAVLINKAIIEIPPRFAGMEPVNPDWRSKPEGERALKTWKGAEGLAEDVRYYGRWMRDEAEKRIGHLYPKVTITEEMAKDRPDLKKYVGRELTVIAWLWARTVRCPNPACGTSMPLAASYWLSKKKHRKAWVEPRRESGQLRFKVVTGRGLPPDPPKLGRGANFRCEYCGQTADGDHIKAEGMAGRMGQQLMSIVLEGDRERIYAEPSVQPTIALSPSDEQLVREVQSTTLAGSTPPRLTGGTCYGYGLTTWGDLFTSRQLVALATFSDLLKEARTRIEADASAVQHSRAPSTSQSPPVAASTYGDAIAIYLSFALDKTAEYGCTLVPWYSKEDRPKGVFARQALPMVWDFAETNPLGSIGGTLEVSADIVANALSGCAAEGSAGFVTREDVLEAWWSRDRAVVCTDPPYYDNIGYADLSDFFYVWLRRNLSGVVPGLFETVLTPKESELVATPYRHRTDGTPPKEFFEHGLLAAFEGIRLRQLDGEPVVVFYAFKQAEGGGEDGRNSATGWDTMLSSLVKAGLSVDATWPMRTERGTRSVGIGTNALASSIVLVCRPRQDGAPLGTRNELVAALKRELPSAVKRLQAASIAPVDLAQSAIGPGMAVFSRYAKVLEPDGSAMSVRTALGLINQVLDEVLAAEESELDADTRWAVTWFTQYSYREAPYGEAEVLATARNTSVSGLERAGILAARGGKARLLKREELEEGWDPATDDRFTVWEACQHLIKQYAEGGERGAADLLRRLGTAAEPARELAYRLYQHCERGGDAEEARAYNGLVVAWPRLASLAAGFPEQPADVAIDFDAGEEE